MAAAVASIIGGVTADALAFTGSQVAAKALGGDGGSIKEVKRHNEALKQLQKDQAEYNQKRADAIYKLNAKLAGEGVATRRLDDYAKASQLYKEVMNNKACR